MMRCQIPTCSSIDSWLHFLSPFARLTSSFLGICISAAVLLCSPSSLHLSLEIFSSLVCSSCLRPSLTCLFPNRIAPFLFLPLLHLVPRLLFTICLGPSSANTGLFVFHFHTQASSPPPPSSFSPLFPALLCLRLHITTLRVCFLR